MRKVLMTLSILAGCAVTAAAKTEATFDRSLTVQGQARVEISSDAGDVHLFKGADHQIHIVAKVVCNGHTECNPKASEIAANPPIEQNGDVIVIGKHKDHWRNVSINYEIQVPENAQLKVDTGAGDVKLDAVGVNVEIWTGAGNVFAAGEQGSLQVKTGAGDVRVSGKPNNTWKLHSGAGDVKVEIGSAGADLNAHTGAGSIELKQKVNGWDSDKNHIETKLNGGGPEVKIDTGAGDIHVL